MATGLIYFYDVPGGYVGQVQSEDLERRHANHLKQRESKFDRFLQSLPDPKPEPVILRWIHAEDKRILAQLLMRYEAEEMITRRTLRRLFPERGGWNFARPTFPHLYEDLVNAQTPEQRSQAAYKWHSRFTKEQWSEITTRGHYSLTADQRSERARKGKASMRPEHRRAIAMQASEAALEAHQNRAPEEKAELAKKRGEGNRRWWGSASVEQRKQRNSAALLRMNSRSHEERSRAAKKWMASKSHG